jgi:hypothetical protein
MAIAFSTNVSSAAATTTNIAVNITVSGTNPVLIGKVALDSATATVTSATWSLGSGTALEVKSLRAGIGPLTSIWAVPAPTGGAGSLRLGFSASVPAHSDTALWTGADQTTPCPTGDAVVTTSNAGTSVLTPTNLTANDGTDCMGANVISGNWNNCTPHQRSIDNASSPGILTGDATGTTGVTMNNDAAMPSNGVAIVAVRIQTPLPSGPPLILSQPTDVTVDAFNAANFSVTASSQTGTTLSYQWKENGTNVANATNTSLSINPTAITDQNGVIKVDVWDVNGTTTSNNAILRINFNGSSGAYYLQEVDTSSRYTIENGTGFYLIEGWSPSTGGFVPPFWWGDLDGRGRRFFSDRLN